ncbi:exopolyphosphatase / guanosine-5'-triphosphate,3'-diphosphate pyrophosphatase [Azospirillaceae bacterium]
MPLPFDRPRPTGVAGPSDRIGVLDIGSNSIRLVIYDRLGRTSMPIFNEKVLCALGRGVERSRRLNSQGVTLALSNLTRFKALADGMGLPRLEVLATAAVRDAEDGGSFVQEVRERIGLPLRVISGEEEGRLSALGVLSGIPGADGVMGDLGGGSLELTQLNQGTVGTQVSLPLGPLRLMEAASGRLGGGLLRSLIRIWRLCRG